jgi:uncharacterized membrane protein YgaE (UPF0421/DUF939 family)
MMQAGAAAILIFAAPDAGSPGTALSRVLDAHIGGGCAGRVSLVVLPPDPAKLLIPRIEALHAELAEVLDDIAAALRTQRTDAAAAALERARGQPAISSKRDPPRCRRDRPPRSRPTRCARTR